jgi:hypothetical protein
LHEEIMRVLVIGDLQSFVRFAHLEDLRVALSGRGQRLGRDHRGGAEQPWPKLMAARSHQPILRFELGLPAPSALDVHRRKQDAVNSRRPTCCGRTGLMTLVILMIRGRFLLRSDGRRRQ